MIETVRACMGRAMKLDPATLAGINEQTTAAEVKGWTSVGHLSLVLELEKTFKVQFGNEEIVQLGSVGAILTALASKTSTA